MNCYKCQYRSDLEYSAHSECFHPDIGGKNNIIGLYLFYVTRANPLNIKANHHGIKKGWFNWPINFDPVWLENCDGFTQIKEEKDESSIQNIKK